MKKIHVRLHRSPDHIDDVGDLASDGRRTAFQYTDAFVRGGLPLSPFRLPLQPGLQEYRPDPTFGPLPGLFDDSLPDGWGLLLMDRQLRQRGVDVRAISPLDRLTYLGRRTMGALTYHPAEDVEVVSGRVDLARLGEQSAEIFAGETDVVLPMLAAAGGSAGGARPKVVVGIKGDDVIAGDDDLPDGYEHWIVKFGADSDGVDAGRVEHAYLLMAASAGLDVPQTRLFEVGHGRAYVGVRRFDRGPGNRRVHMQTLSGLLHATFRAPSVDYDALLIVAARLTRDQRAVMEAFRRMAFNVVAQYRDDHTKNVAFLMDDDGMWRIAPAYDLTYSTGPGGEHTMAVDGEGRSSGPEHLIAVARRAGMREASASAALELVESAVSRWAEFASASGVGERTAGEIGAVLERWPPR